MSSAPSTPSKLMDTGHDETPNEDFKHQNYCEETVVLLGKCENKHLLMKQNETSYV